MQTFIFIFTGNILLGHPAQNGCKYMTLFYIWDFIISLSIEVEKLCFPFTIWLIIRKVSLKTAITFNILNITSLIVFCIGVLEQL